MKKILSLALLMMAATCICAAQQYDFSHAMVNGLKIFHEYTYMEIGMIKALAAEFGRDPYKYNNP